MSNALELTPRLTLVTGESRDFQLKVEPDDPTVVWTDDNPSPFLDSDTLVSTVWADAFPSPLLTLTTTWVDVATATFQVTFNNTDTTGFLPGAYRIQTSSTRSGRSRYILNTEIDLTVSPNSGSVGLVSIDEAQAALPDLNDAQIAALPSLIAAATNAIEGFCRRKLALRMFDRLYRPGRTRKVWLDTWPVQQMGRFKTDLLIVATIQNVSPLVNQVATVQKTATTLTLTTVASGVSTNLTFTLSDYLTVQALVNAINAGGSSAGWQALTQASTPASNLAPVSELTNDIETVGALQAQAELRWYSRDITRYVLNPDRGYIEMTENRPEAFRYGDRAYGIGFGWSWSAAAEPRHAAVRAIYRAGYAVQISDISAGYAPVPDDLKRATLLAVRAGLNVTASPDLESESDGAYSYRRFERPLVLPASAQQLLLSGGHVSNRIGGSLKI